MHHFAGFDNQSAHELHGVQAAQQSLAGSRTGEARRQVPAKTKEQVSSVHAVAKQFVQHSNAMGGGPRQTVSR